MKIKDLIYKTPEMTEEKLLTIINNELNNFKDKFIIERIQKIHNYSDDINKLILKEYDLIQDKQSYLTKSQRTMITGLVGLCMIKMVKDDGTSRE